MRRLFLRDMPIYMDRHDVSESVTAENLAQLHQQDLRVQDRFGCKGLTYWFDDKRKMAFCLIEASNERAIREMHDYAHGKVPHRVIEVDPSIVESFLGRIQDPEKAQNVELNIINDPAFRTIMVVDIQLLALTRDYLARFRTGVEQFALSVQEVLRDFGGSLAKRVNEHFVISFRSVSNAVHAAVELQKYFAGFRNGIRKDVLVFKIGLSTGVPVTERNLIFEDAIRLAERMTLIAAADIVVSAEVRELYDSENTAPLAGHEGIYCLTEDDEQFLTRLVDYTESKGSDIDLKVDDLNKPVGYSKPQLYRKMILLTGKSPITFIKDYRLNEALSLLNRDAGNISQIAYETGFSSPSYFTKCFQKRYGQSPTEYLAARAGDEILPAFESIVTTDGFNGD
jgi:AraC-like DNA-binding protein